jgi:hypothetical protein
MFRIVTAVQQFMAEFSQYWLWTTCSGKYLQYSSS